MRRFYLLFICCLTACSITHQNEAGADVEPMQFTPRLYPLECLSQELYLQTFKIDETKPMSYDNIKILIHHRQDGHSVVPSFEENADDYEQTRQLFHQAAESEAYSVDLKQKQEKVYSAKTEAPFKQRWHEDNLLDGGIASIPIVISDKQLFGIPSGDNLLECFQVCELYEKSHYQFWYSDFSLKWSNESEYVDIPLSEFYSAGTLLLPSCYFRFKDVPKEQYDKFELTIIVPITGESSLKYLPDYGLYQDQDYKVVSSISGSITIELR